MRTARVEVHAAFLVDQGLQQLEFGFRELHLQTGASHGCLCSVLSPYLEVEALRARSGGPACGPLAGIFPLCSWPPNSRSLAISSSTINRPWYFPRPVTQFNLPSRNSVGDGSTSVAGILMTSEAESTISPDSLPLCSSTRMRLRRLGAVSRSPSRFRKSSTETILPRRLMTPSI